MLSRARSAARSLITKLSASNSVHVAIQAPLVPTVPCCRTLGASSPRELPKSKNQAAHSAAPVQLKTLRMSPGLHPVLSVAPQVLGSARPAAHSVATRIERNPPPRAPWTAPPPLQTLLLVAWLYRLTWPTSIAAEAPATAAQTWAAALLGTGWRPGDIRRALVPRIQSWAKRSGSEPPRL